MWRVIKFIKAAPFWLWDIHWASGFCMISKDYSYIQSVPSINSNKDVLCLYHALEAYLKSQWKTLPPCQIFVLRVCSTINVALGIQMLTDSVIWQHNFICKYFMDWTSDSWLERFSLLNWSSWKRQNGKQIDNECLRLLNGTSIRV